MAHLAFEQETNDHSESKRLKLGIVLYEEMTELRKDNDLPKQVMSLDSFMDERPTSGEVDTPETGKYEGEELQVTEIRVRSRMDKRTPSSADKIQMLNLLGPGDKVACGECYKIVKSSSFPRHLRTHSGVKPYGCEECNATFTRKPDVRRHVRTVHLKQKQFKCCKCLRAFREKGQLHRHLINHENTFFYSCEVCGFTFFNRDYWAHHVRFIHPLPSLEEEIEEEGVEAQTEVSGPIECEMPNSPGVHIVSDDSRTDVVVLEINENYTHSGDEWKPEPRVHEEAANLIHVVSPRHESRQ